MNAKKSKIGQNFAITAHPLFPAIVGLWFAALIGIGSLIVPTVLFEKIVSAIGLPAIISAAAPPLGLTAKLAIATVAALFGFALGFLIGRKVAQAPETKAGSERSKKFGKKSKRKAPISAHEELGNESLDEPISQDHPHRRRSLAMKEEPMRSEYTNHAPLPGNVDEPLVLFEEAPLPMGRKSQQTEMAEEWDEVLGKNEKQEFQAAPQSDPASFDVAGTTPTPIGRFHVEEFVESNQPDELAAETPADQAADQTFAASNHEFEGIEQETMQYSSIERSVRMTAASQDLAPAIGPNFGAIHESAASTDFDEHFDEAIEPSNEVQNTDQAIAPQEFRTHEVFEADLPIEENELEDPSNLLEIDIEPRAEEPEPRQEFQPAPANLHFDPSASHVAESISVPPHGADEFAQNDMLEETGEVPLAGANSVDAFNNENNHHAPLPFSPPSLAKSEEPSLPADYEEEQANILASAKETEAKETEPAEKLEPSGPHEHLSVEVAPNTEDETFDNAPEQAEPNAPVANRDLGALGTVELVERLAFAMQRKQSDEMSAEDKHTPATMKEQPPHQEPGNEQEQSSAVEEMSAPKQTFEPSAATSAPVAMPRAMRPINLTEIESEEIDDKAEIDVSFRLPTTDIPSQQEAEQQNDAAKTVGFSADFAAQYQSAEEQPFQASDDSMVANAHASLLSMKTKTTKRTSSPETQDAEVPAQVGHEAISGHDTISSDTSVASATSREASAMPSETKPSPTEAIEPQDEMPAPSRKIDSSEAEFQMRNALAALQRISKTG